MAFIPFFIILYKTYYSINILIIILNNGVNFINEVKGIP